MIPKIIHCCWLGGGPKTKLARTCRASWERFLTQRRRGAEDGACGEAWRICEWDDGKVRAELKDLPGFAFYEAAIAARKWAFAADWFRFAVLARKGGVYLDYDVELARPVDELLDRGEFVAGQWFPSGSVGMEPAALALEKGSPVAGAMLDHYEKAAFDGKTTVGEILGEIVKTRGVAEHWNLRVLPPEVMSPIDCSGRLHRTEATVGIHHYAMSWVPWWRRALQWVCWHGGRGLVDWMLSLRTGWRSGRRIVASFWEEHCQECGMPACYSTCQQFERGWHGRCVRLDGFEESIRGVGAFSFRRWGKLELVFHGRVTTEWLAVLLETCNRALRAVWRVLGMRHRAVRRRATVLFGWPGRPVLWRLRLRSEGAERLSVAIADPSGRRIWRMPVLLDPDCEKTFEFSLPEVSAGMLFQVFPTDGEPTGKIFFRENALVESAPISDANDLVKCVVWDLDGVVWTGVLSEGEDVYVNKDVLETIRALDERGVVSSICSKNDRNEALAALKRLGIEQWFVFPQISWGAKSEGLRNLAREMNISPESMAFVDDREENRAEVRERLPEVLVEDETFPRIRELAARPIVAGTLGSSRRKAYQAEMERQRDMRLFDGKAEEFDDVCGLSVELLSVTGDRVPRCRELVNRTNKLNISGRRYDEAAFRSLISRCDARCVRASDRYGDYGIVGFVAWRGNVLEELCFSCRVANRGVERKVLPLIVREHGKLVANNVHNGRNEAFLKIVEAFL